MGNGGKMHHTRNGRNPYPVAMPIPEHYRKDNMVGADARIPFPYP